MEEHLVGYLMNSLEPEEHQQVEQYLQEHPEAQQRLDLLKRSLEPLSADQDTIEPPHHMCFRTIARIAEFSCRTLPPAPEIVPAAEAPPAALTPWYRRADVLVAASLFIAVLGVGVPGISQFRSFQDRKACANNLMQYHQVLTAYADGHDGNYPGFGLTPPHDVAGMYLPILQEAGFDLTKVKTCCPAVRDGHYDGYTATNLRQQSPEEFDKLAPKLSRCYAYSLGYRDPVNGQHMGLRRGQAGDLSNDAIPIMADRPAGIGDNRTNSDNHGGGQNVLYMGGNVQFHTTPTINDDHIYRNKDGKVAAGHDRYDAVLGNSEDRPFPERKTVENQQ
jgi:hypothetical protein